MATHAQAIEISGTASITMATHAQAIAPAYAFVD